MNNSCVTESNISYISYNGQGAKPGGKHSEKEFLDIMNKNKTFKNKCREKFHIEGFLERCNLHEYVAYSGAKIEYNPTLPVNLNLPPLGDIPAESSLSQASELARTTLKNINNLLEEITANGVSIGNLNMNYQKECLEYFKKKFIKDVFSLQEKEIKKKNNIINNLVNYHLKFNIIKIDGILYKKVSLLYEYGFFMGGPTEKPLCPEKLKKMLGLETMKGGRPLTRCKRGSRRNRLTKRCRKYKRRV
uniref:Uncharacterized protein n=1 Tax=viral metagenome TaxID=1070528 RepID=A0A6C0I5S1_9ZZZZ